LSCLTATTMTSNPPSSSTRCWMRNRDQLSSRPDERCVSSCLGIFILCIVFVSTSTVSVSWDGLQVECDKDSDNVSDHLNKGRVPFYHNCFNWKLCCLRKHLITRIWLEQDYTAILDHVPNLIYLKNVASNPHLFTRNANTYANLEKPLKTSLNFTMAMARIQKDSNFPRYREWYLTCPGMTSPLIPLMLMPAKRPYNLVRGVRRTGGSGSVHEGNTITL
jgi:hypothetical protein